jgi:hypothetical protein
MRLASDAKPTMIVKTRRTTWMTVDDAEGRVSSRNGARSSPAPLGFVTKRDDSRRPDPERIAARMDRAKELVLAGELEAARAAWADVERLLEPTGSGRQAPTNSRPPALLALTSSLCRSLGALTPRAMGPR